MDPYAAPQADIRQTDDQMRFPPASPGKRFLNFMIDQIVVMVVIAFLIAFALSFIMDEGRVTSLLDAAGGYPFAIILLLLYYVPLELTSGVTLGKLITGTRVVRTDAAQSRPGAGQILGRTLTRLIPFEPLSILGKAMWHDSMSGTTVVDIRNPVRKARVLSEAEIRARISRMAAAGPKPASGPPQPPPLTGKQ